MVDQMKNGMLLVPQPPGFRTIFHKSEGEIERSEVALARRKSYLYFPHMLFGILYQQRGSTFQLIRLQVGFSKEPFTGNKSEKLYGLPLNNIDEGFNVCLYENPTANSLPELARKCIELFWSSPFVNYNDGYSHWKDQMYKKGFLTRWKKASKENTAEAFFEKAELEQASYIVTIGKLLETHKTTIGGNVKVLTDIKKKIKKK